MIKPVRPWSPNEDCPLEGFQDFRKELMQASFHNAAPGSGELAPARKAVKDAAKIAIDEGWPYWAMERMFKEIKPLVAWDQFMQSYIDLLYGGYSVKKNQ